MSRLINIGILFSSCISGTGRSDARYRSPLFTGFPSICCISLFSVSISFSLFLSLFFFVAPRTNTFIVASLFNRTNSAKFLTGNSLISLRREGSLTEWDSWFEIFFWSQIFIWFIWSSFFCSSGFFLDPRVLDLVVNFQSNKLRTKLFNDSSQILKDGGRNFLNLNALL